MCSSGACGIEFEDQVIVTGGVNSKSIVSVYNDGGWVKDLASLNIGRYAHSCGHYNSDNDLVKKFPKFVTCIVYYLNFCRNTLWQEAEILLAPISPAQRYIAHTKRNGNLVFNYLLLDPSIPKEFQR